MIDKKNVRAQAETSVIRGCPELVEVSGGQARLVRVLRDAPRIDAVDAPAVIERKSQRDIFRGDEREIAFPLPSSCILCAAIFRIDPILNAVAKLIVAKAAA